MIHSIEELETAFDSFEPPIPDRRTREYRLDRMRLLLAHLGNPERKFRTYHAAGSKGKGSTCAYLAALLTGCGRKCGLYASPHLYTIRERFTLSGKFFSDSEYIETFNAMMEAISDFSLPENCGPSSPTTFEAYTAYAYLLFSNTGCTDAVIETGLGGRLDATNTIDPEAVMLTPVELEHTNILGNSIRAIAGEKAKIIVEGKPVFVSSQSADAEEVFRREADEKNAPITFLHETAKEFSSRTEKDGERVSFILDGRKYSLNLRMTTAAMAENAALAVLTAARLGFLSDEGLRLLERTELPGRFERRVVNGHLLVIDTAHTVNSVIATRDAFFRLSDADDPVLIFGAVEGKDIEHMAAELFPPFRRIIISRPGTFKKSDPEGIFRAAQRMFPEKEISLVVNQDEALDSALSLSSDILITGSFYLAAGMERLRK